MQLHNGIALVLIVTLTLVGVAMCKAVEDSKAADTRGAECADAGGVMFWDRTKGRRVTGVCLNKEAIMLDY